MVALLEQIDRSESLGARETEVIVRTVEYKRCAIHAASYQAGRNEWVPEANFWKYTEMGWRRFWIKSFAHLFGSQGLTFASQRDADFQAFGLARTLIDTIRGELEKPHPEPPPSLANYLKKIFWTH